MQIRTRFLTQLLAVASLGTSASLPLQAAEELSPAEQQARFDAMPDTPGTGPFPAMKDRLSPCRSRSTG